MHLADGSRSVGCLLQVLEKLGDRFAQFRFDLPHDDLKRHGRGFFLKLLERVREFLGQKVLGLGSDLPDFHDRPFQLAQGIGDLVGHACVAFALRALVIF